MKARTAPRWIRNLLMLLAGAAFCVPRHAQAQYDERESFEPTIARFGYAGAQVVDFAPRPANPVGDSLRMRFVRIMPIIGLRQGSTDIMFGYTRFDQHGTSRPLYFLSATIGMELPLSGRGPGTLMLPLALSADFTRAEASGLQRDDFNVGSLGIGAGLRYRVRGQGLEFIATAVAGAQLSFEGFSGSGGSSVIGIGEAVLHLYDVLVADGFVIGYRFRYESWSMNRGQADYRSLWHGPFLGVMF